MCGACNVPVSVCDYWLTEIPQGLVSIREQERNSMQTPAPRAASIDGRRRYLLGTVLGLAVARSISAADTLRKVSVAIDAGNAPATLAELIRQTGLQILFEADAVRGHTTRAVRGELDADEALHLMLEGSGLIFEVINARTIAVRPAAVPHSAGT
jgi:Secretin and TonB N terminus short domain